MQQTSTASQNSEPLAHSKYRADIDGLRAIAILSVLGFHAFPAKVKGGFIGVDIFFVISGFLISTILFGNLKRNTFSFIEFYSRRIKRIFPALLFVLIACFALGWFTLLPNEFKQLCKHIAGGASFISNYVLLNESGYFDNSAETKPLLHLWSLGIEEQFYIVWPLLLWLVWKTRVNLLLFALAAAIVSFMLNIKGVQKNAVQIFYSPQTRFWELLAGSVLAYLTLYKSEIFSKFKANVDEPLNSNLHTQKPTASYVLFSTLLSLLGISLIIFGFLYTTKEKEFPGWWAVLPIGGATLIISAGPHAWFNRFVLSNRVLVWVGLISYPLYLWHWPLLSFARILESKEPSDGIRIVAVVSSIVLAWLTYRWVEKPIRFGSYDKPKTIALFMLMATTGTIGYIGYQKNGLGFRFPKMVQDLTEFTYDYGKYFREGTCFLRPEQNYDTFSTCETLRADSKKPSLLLWGDSHAAQLFSGYNAHWSSEFNILQRTASMCPPILNMEINNRPYCKGINNFVFEFIKKEKPNKIVLVAAWPFYDWKKLEGTIVKLQQIGMNNIDIVGPVTQWADNLSKLLYLQMKSEKFHRVPKRMNFGLHQNFLQLDPILFAYSKELQVNYISAAKILCNEDGCLTRFGETSDLIAAFDNAHLTEASSIFLVSQFPKTAPLLPRNAVP